MELDTEEKKFLKNLIEHAKKGPNSCRKTLKEANIPLNRSLEQTHSEFGPYQEDEEQIIQSLFDKDILKIKIKEREIHQSMDKNEKSKSKDLLKGIGLNENRVDEIIETLVEED